MNELLDLTGKINLNTVSALRAVDVVVSSFKLPYIIVGATARDMVLHFGYGAPVQRATTDIDFAVQVETWENFMAVKEQLVKNGFVYTQTEHRLISPTKIPIDIVPFGGIEQGNSNIAWPLSGDRVMSVRGFREAVANAQRVMISKNPEVVCPVVTPESLMFLKLISWADRPREMRRKDANDIRYLLTSYHGIKNIREDIYDDENIGEFERYDWDPEQAACSLLGKVCREIVSDDTHAEILKLTDSTNHKNIERIVDDMLEGTADDNLKLLEAFMNGFDKRSC
jgi:predicted nucleotidyltransferase